MILTRTVRRINIGAERGTVIKKWKDFSFDQKEDD